MRLTTKALLVGAALACAAGPALASGAGGSFIAIDYAWQANGTDATTLTITPGQTVTFAYPSGASYHDVDFTGSKPACTGLPDVPKRKGWAGECTFAAAGSYPFVCDFHPEMVGTVVVAAPTPTATPTPTASADPSATPGPNATPTATPPPGEGASSTPVTAKPAALKLKLATTQRGTRVRGSVTVPEAAARLEVTVKAGGAKVGSWVERASKTGRVTFSIRLSAKARKTLRAKGRLRVAVAVAFTGPYGKKLRTSAKVVVRPG